MSIHGGKKMYQRTQWQHEGKPTNTLETPVKDQDSRNTYADTHIKNITYLFINCLCCQWLSKLIYVLQKTNSDSSVIWSKKLHNSRQNLKTDSILNLCTKPSNHLCRMANTNMYWLKVNKLRQTLVLNWSAGSQEPIFNSTVKAGAAAEPNSRADANTGSNYSQSR
jgi:hypothetical protein